MASNPPSSARRVRSAHESKSATVRAAAAAPSRRQHSRWQREQQQQRMLYVAIGVLVLVVAAIFAGGIFYDNFVRANTVVAQIGPDSITASQLLDEVRPQARAIDAQAQLYGGTDNQNIASYVDQQKRSLPDSVLNELIDVHLIQQEASRRGISVSPAEIDGKEHETVAQFQASQSPAPEPTPADATTPQATGEALTSATPTAVPTLDDSAYGPALQKLLGQDKMTEADLRIQLERGLLQDKVQTAIGQDQVPDAQPQAHARQIVVATQDQANALLNQLNAGADFAQLAQQNSTDTATRANSGDMGWFPKGVQTAPIDAAVFTLQPGQLSSVIQDTAGFHILQVLETDPSRPVPADQLTTLRQRAYTSWLSSQSGGSNVKLSLDQSDKNWILSRIGVRP